MASVFAKPNKFNLSHTNILTCDMGALVPFLTQEVLPGDEFRIRTDAMVRLAPMLAPIFGEVDFYTHYFFVPNRLVWKDWESFITSGLETGSDSSVMPYLSFANTSNPSWFGPGTLFDYLDIDMRDNAGINGASVASPVGMRFCGLSVRVYNKIFNDWYRNEFLQPAVPLSLNGGAMNGTSDNLVLQKRCWPRDYMTSALPFTQLGNPVTIPVGAANAPVVGDGSALGLAPVTIAGGTDGKNYLDSLSTTVYAGTGASSFPSPAGIGVSTDKTKSGLVADLSSAQAVTINDLRTAFQLQRILERKARSGNRYVEYLAASFGVRSPDARLQRAEFLGGGKSPIMISEVLQTSAGTQSSPQGNMSGHGFGASRSFSVNKAFTEHGYIMGILSIMPKPSYFQGRKRELARWTWSDYYQPEFAHLGEQAVFKSEVLCNASTATADFTPGDIFGFQPRYEEYRRKLSGVHGDFRASLSFWHLARVFSSAPSLNADFIECAPSKRIFAAAEQADRPCWVMMNLDVRAIRPLPKHGNPGLIDH